MKPPKSHKTQIKFLINIGQIKNCPHENARLVGENEFWQAANHIALALLLIGQQGPRLCSSGARSPQATNIWFRATEK